MFNIKKTEHYSLTSLARDWSLFKKVHTILIVTGGKSKAIEMSQKRLRKCIKNVFKKMMSFVCLSFYT